MKGNHVDKNLNVGLKPKQFWDMVKKDLQAEF
jgi:hypothetical protein